MSKEVIEALRKQAQEIAGEGHFGWGNTMTAAADAIDALLAENERLESAWKVDAMKRKDALIEMQEKENDRVKAELSALLAERDALAKDAERYRWLRNTAMETGDVAPAVLMVDGECKPAFDEAGYGHESARSGASLDASIDAALQGEQS